MSGIGLKPFVVHARALSDVDADFGLGTEDDTFGNGTGGATTNNTGSSNNGNNGSLSTQYRPSGRITSPISPIPMTPTLGLTDVLLSSSGATNKQMIVSSSSTTNSSSSSVIITPTVITSSSITTSNNGKPSRVLLREPTIVTVDDTELGSSDDEDEKILIRSTTESKNSLGANGEGSTLSRHSNNHYSSDDDEDYFAFEFKPLVPAGGRISANAVPLVRNITTVSPPYGYTQPILNSTNSSFPLPLNLQSATKAPVASSSSTSSSSTGTQIPSSTTNVSSTMPSEKRFSPSLSSAITQNINNRKASQNHLKSTTSFSLSGTHTTASVNNVSLDPQHTDHMLSNDITVGSASSRVYGTAPAPASPTRSPSLLQNNNSGSSSTTNNASAHTTTNPPRINSLLSMGNIINTAPSNSVAHNTANVTGGTTSSSSTSSSSNDSPPSMVAVPASTAIAQISELIKGSISPQNTVKGAKSISSSSHSATSSLLRQPLQLLHAFSPVTHTESKPIPSTTSNNTTNIPTTTASTISSTTVPSTESSSVSSSPHLSRKVSSSSTVSSPPLPISQSTTGSSRTLYDDSIPRNVSNFDTNIAAAINTVDKYVSIQQTTTSVSSSIENNTTLEKRNSSSELVGTTTTTTTTGPITDTVAKTSVLSPRRGVSQSGASFFGAISRAAVEDPVTVTTTINPNSSTVERSEPLPDTTTTTQSAHTPSHIHRSSQQHQQHQYFEKGKDSLSVSMLKDLILNPDNDDDQHRPLSATTTSIVPVSAITTGRVMLLSSSMNKGIRTTTLASSAISGRLKPLSATKNSNLSNTVSLSDQPAVQIFNEAIPDFSTVKAKISTHWSADNSVSKLYGFDQPSINHTGPRVLQFHDKSWTDISSTLDQIILDVRNEQQNDSLLSPYRSLSSSTGRNSIRLSLSSISNNRPALSCLRVLVLRNCNLSVQNILSLPLMPKLLGCDLSDNTLTGLGTPQSVTELSTQAPGNLASIHESVSSPRKGSNASTKGKGITDDPSVLENLCWLAFAPHARALVLRGCGLTEVPALVAGTSLESLDLSCNRISFPTGFDTVANTVTSIDLSYNDISTTNSLRGLPSLKFLSSLQLHPNPITLTTLPHILRATLIDMLPQLETIDGVATPPSTIKVTLAKERVPIKAKYRRQQVLKERGLIPPRIHPYGAATTLLAEALQVADTDINNSFMHSDKPMGSRSEILPSATIIRTRNIINKPTTRGSVTKSTVGNSTDSPNDRNSPLPTETLPKKSKKTMASTTTARSQRDRMSELATPVKRPPPPPRPEDLPPPPLPIIPPSSSKKRTKRTSVTKVTWDTIPNMADLPSVADNVADRMQAKNAFAKETDTLEPATANHAAVNSPVTNPIMSPIPKIKDEWSPTTAEWINRIGRKTLALLATVKQILKEFLPNFDISANRIHDIMDNLLEIGGIDDDDYDNIMKIIQEHASGGHDNDAILYQAIHTLATEELSMQANVLFDGLDVSVMTGDEQQEIIQLAGKVATALAALKHLCALIANPLTMNDHFVYYSISVQRSAIGTLCTPFLSSLGLGGKEKTLDDDDEDEDETDTATTKQTDKPNVQENLTHETTSAVTDGVVPLVVALSGGSTPTSHHSSTSLPLSSSATVVVNTVVETPRETISNGTGISLSVPTINQKYNGISSSLTTNTTAAFSIHNAVLEFDD